MEKKIRILLVDDHQVVRDGLQHMLSQERDMEVVGQSANGEEALSQVEMLSPDVVLMDIKMPGVNGIELTRQVREKKPSCDVIMLTMYDEYLTEAMQAGAVGYLLKDVKRDELARAIRQVYGGIVVISENISAAYRSKHEVASGGKGGESRMPRYDDSGLLQEVRLVIPPSVDNGRLVGFLSRVQVMLDSRIQEMVSSWKGGTAVTVPLPKPTLLENILDKLKAISEVEAVGEEPFNGEKDSSLLNSVLPSEKQKTLPSKVVFINLKNG